MSSLTVVDFHSVQNWMIIIILVPLSQFRWGRRNLSKKKYKTKNNLSIIQNWIILATKKKNNQTWYITKNSCLIDNLIDVKYVRVKNVKLLWVSVEHYKITRHVNHPWIYSRVYNIETKTSAITFRIDKVRL